MNTFEMLLLLGGTAVCTAAIVALRQAIALRRALKQ